MRLQHGKFIAPGYQDDILLHIPEEAGQYEWHDGHILEVTEPDVGHGRVCLGIGSRLHTHVEANNLGFVAINDPLILLQEEPRLVYGPDVVFFEKSHAPVIEYGVCAVMPALVVEVQSKRQSGTFLRRKSEDYLRAGVRLVWVINAKKRTIVRYRSGAEPVTFNENDVLDGEDIVPGFTCRVADLFPAGAYGIPGKSH
jgi:Uma2 family endonuclease